MAMMDQSSRLAHILYQRLAFAVSDSSKQEQVWDLLAKPFGVGYFWT